MTVKQKLIEYLTKFLDINSKTISENLIRQENLGLGHFSLRCFALSSNFSGKSPQEIAKIILEKLGANSKFFEARVTGPYLNFYIKNDFWTQEVLKNIKKNLAPQKRKKSEPIVLDFSSPNIAKPFHLGHLRSTVIGNALRNLFNFAGYKTIAINHLGDWGTQFGMLGLAWKKWGSGKFDTQIPLNKLFELYVKIHSEMEQDPKIIEEARAWFKKLEEGDIEAKKFWKVAKAVSLKEFERIYTRLKIKFDVTPGESFYIRQIPSLEKILQEKNLLIQSLGAKIIDLGENMPPFIFKKSDQSSLYDTRELAAALYRYKKYKFEKMIYVVGTPQKMHFQQLFALLKKMDLPWWQKCIHADFGHIALQEGAMSTRKGKVIFLEDVLNESVKKVRKIIEEKNPSLPKKEAVAEAVGIGAIIFYDLERNRTKDYIFDWNLMLNFDGHSGPYVQYTYARIQSLLKKTKKYGQKISSLGINDEISLKILSILDEFPEAIKDSINLYQPSILAQYVLKLADAFNEFYEKNRIDGEEKNVAQSRRSLANATAQTIKTCLKILGLQTPERL
jgi:arginyl-tRNA synthetase